MTAFAWLARTSASEPGAKRTRPLETSCRRVTHPKRTCPSPRHRPAPARSELRRDGAFRALEQHCDATGMKHVESARLELRAEQFSDDTRGVVGLDDERSGRLRQRMELEACSRDEGETPRGATHETCQVVPRDVLHDLPPALAIVPSASTSVAPSTRSRGAPKRWRSGPERFCARSAPIVGSPGGSSESRCPLAARSARSSESRTPASTVHVRSPGSCSRIWFSPAAVRSSPIRSRRPSACAAASAARPPRD